VRQHRDPGGRGWGKPATAAGQRFERIWIHALARVGVLAVGDAVAVPWIGAIGGLPGSGHAVVVIIRIDVVGNASFAVIVADARRPVAPQSLAVLEADAGAVVTLADRLGEGDGFDLVGEDPVGRRKAIAEQLSIKPSAAA
jgi:hypothetical protein